MSVARPFRARVVPLALVAMGLIAGAAFDTRRAPQPVRAGGYYILAADFHVHAFPGDGALPGPELAREASRRGLHAIVISNHNQTLAAKTLPGWIYPVAEPLLIPSQEITTPRFHLIAAGIRRTIDWRKPEAEILRDVHEQGGVVILAHPVAGRGWTYSDTLLSGVDGVEVAHPITTTLAAARDTLTQTFTRARALNPGVAPIGSSDFHMVAPLGSCRTYVFAEAVSVQAVLDAVRAGRTVAQDQDGVLYGAPELTHLMDGTRAAFPMPPPGRRVQLAGLLVLLGFLGLVVGREL